MTQEQKAKAYDEALRVIKDNLDALNEVTKTGAESVNIQAIKNCFYRAFPELKESESEKIRNSLVDYFEDFSLPTFAGLNPKKILAWLKQQGEHANFRNKIQIGDKVTRNEDGVLVNMSQLKRVAKPADKQGEQKPAENLIETWKDMRLEVYQQASGNRHEPNCSDDTTKMFSLNDIDEIVEKMSEQKPTDKVEPKFRIGDFVKNTNYQGEPIYEIVYMDKECYICEYRGKENMGDKTVIHFAFDNPYLRLVEQKPAEWSKEDEDYINDLIKYFSQNDRLENTKEDIVIWLKSLRPQNRQKPSEEMLEALYKVIPENVMEISEDEILLDKLYQGLKYGRVLGKN